MKKQLLLFALALLCFGVSNSYGQATFGIKAGANIANANFDSGTSVTIKPDALVGFYAGAFARLGVSSQFAIQPELLLSMQGFKWNLDGLFGEEVEDVGETTIQNLYLNLPIMLRFAATDALHLEAGPQVGLLLSSEAKADSGSGDLEDTFEDLDFGVNIGAGYTLPLGLSIDARYNFGLADMAGESEGEGSITNRVFSFGLGYTF